MEQFAKRQLWLFGLIFFIAAVLLLLFPVQAQALQKVSGLTQTGAATTSISMSWDAVDGADYYQVDLSATKGSYGDADYSATTTSFSISSSTKLSAGTAYYISVRACSSSSGWGGGIFRSGRNGDSTEYPRRYHPDKCNNKFCYVFYY